jgi:hypothetical protein
MVRSDRTVADYDELFDPIRKGRQEKSGKQLGDPAKLAAAVLKLIESDNPPPQLLLGSDALELVRDKLARMAKEFDAWEELTVSTDS